MAGQMWDLAETPIGKAIETGDVNEVNRLARSGENIHFKDRKQNTYLHFICTMYKPSIFYALVAHKIDISAQNRHGNTALHVTALQRECCHVADLMACGIDPFIKNKDGKTAEELGTQNKYWHMIYQRYKPGIFHAVQQHDIPRIHQLLRCWCRVDAVYKKQTLRQYAACLKFHDIVIIIDEHKATTDMIYGVFEGNHEKVEEALKMTRCQVNFLNEICSKQHILQYAIKFKDFRFVKMLCDAGADVNMRVRVHNYFWGPLYFEAIHKDVPLNIIWYILKSGADFTLKDERGRTGFMFALDKTNTHIPVEIFQYMLRKGADITERDCTGCNPRDIARFSRRQDVVDLIDKYYIKVIRSSDTMLLTKMAVDGYDSLMITHNYRDTFIYASGNRTDDVLDFIDWLPRFQRIMENQINIMEKSWKYHGTLLKKEVSERLHNAIKKEDVEIVDSIIKSCVSPNLVVQARNKARRTPLIIAVLFDRSDVVEMFLNLPYDININARDCGDRTAYHFACCLGSESGKDIKNQLVEAGVDTSIQDGSGKTGDELAKSINGNEFIQKERKAVYGMLMELFCTDKYEELRKLIRSKRKGLPEFMAFTRNFRFPVIGLYKMLGPLMLNYRDVIFLAIDYGKQEIAYKLAYLGANLVRREKYEKVLEDGTKEVRYYTPAERASHLGMQELADYLTERSALQLDQLKQKNPLLPKRTLETHFGAKFAVKPSTVFVTQSFSLTI